MSTNNNQELEITNEEFKNIINNSSYKVVVVDFFAEWCMPCLMMTPIVEDLSNDIEDAKFVKINIDDNKCLTKRFNVTSVPCILIFKDGKEHCRITGSHPIEVLESKIKACISI